MGTQLRALGWIAAAVLASTFLAGCGHNPPAGAPAAVGTMHSSGGGGMAGGREVKFVLDGPGGITPGGERSTDGVVEEMPAIVHFSGGKVTVETARVLLNDKEIAKLPEDTKIVSVEYTGGTLTIAADDAKVYEVRLRD